MRILGIDPGTAIVGYSIVDFIDNKIELITYGCIYTNKDDGMSLRLEQIYLRLETIINLYKPDQMAIEELFFFKNQKTIISVAQARGVIILLSQLKGMEIFSYTPLQIKTGITGYGRAQKKQVQDMVRMILNLKEIPKPDDAADAIAISISHINNIRGLGGILSSSRSNRNSNNKIKISTKKANVISLDDYKNIVRK